MGFIISIFTRKLEPLVEGKAENSTQQRTENFQVRIGNSKFQIKISSEKKKKKESKIMSSLLKSYWFVYGALLRQSSIFDPKSGKNNAFILAFQ
jgi:hypothetical protein